MLDYHVCSKLCYKCQIKITRKRESVCFDENIAIAKKIMKAPLALQLSSFEVDLYTLKWYIKHLFGMEEIVLHIELHVH